MPSASKKGSANSKSHARDRRSSSRHSTPLTETSPTTPHTATPTAPAVTSAPIPKETPYLRTSTATLLGSGELSIDQLISSNTAASSTSGKNGGDPPTAKQLHALHDKIKQGVDKFMAKREEMCDRSMRQLAQRRKQREAERQSQIEDSERRKSKKAGRKAENAKSSKADPSGDAEDVKLRKRSHDEMYMELDQAEREKDRRGRRESLPSVGAHGVARQDGVGVHEGQPPPPSPKVQPGTSAPDPMDTAESPSDSESSSSDQPATIPLYERAFGKDPTQFDDPTIYDIRPWSPSMSDSEKRAIFNVKVWPESDLKDLTAGDPPDADFSNAKPSNQIAFNTFQTHAEPFIRPFNEEDVAFLKERGDRVTPYTIPPRGSRTYKEVWASEDGLTGLEPPRRQERRADEPRGTFEDMSDEVAETDEVSMGPVMNRLLSVLRPQPPPNNPQPNGVKKEDSTSDAIKDSEGDISMLNGDISLGLGADDPTGGSELRPATSLPADAPKPPDNPTPQDYETLDTRAIQELRYIGFLAPDEIPEYSSHLDDAVAGRLRTLQHELRRISTLNNTRRARVLELTEERMAMQEYSNIADDLDNQVNAAYLKRNRSLAKPSKSKGSAGKPAGGQKGLAVSGSGAAGRTVSDGVKALMQKRSDWINMVGPVVGFGRPPIPGDDETIFDPDSMRRLERIEMEAERDEAEDA
ncbi:hypothetical protein K431DRAFT_312651 [Polychaeton citri CBS 116435]|uniref:Uncharacterized protein n=1 Tax=Polychaeton citri CBS 116435 TaxID=1314669 RepID=A0A9P4Q7T6_9PEZI|nr:hypothetical protein K431DRAFT_312651 [Polychaeton citri CBS 116435]